VGDTEPADTPSLVEQIRLEHLQAFEAFAPTIKVSPGVSEFDFFDVDHQNHRTFLFLP